MPGGRKTFISLLPRHLKEGVELRMEEGSTYAEIEEWLAANGHPEITEDHVGYWYRNRHQKWVQQQKWMQIQSDEKPEMKG